MAEPVNLLGGVVFVYKGRFEIPALAAMSHVNRAFASIRSNHLDEAEQEAKTAIGLCSDDPRPFAALANVLARKNQKEDARRNFEKALELAATEPAIFLNLTVAIRKQLAGRDDK
jgi:Flp pilus assembly protein TadD